jgi:outer membrane protein OmpA-like peptidoglycan-associated protein
MSSRNRLNVTSLLLTSTALTIAALPFAAQAAPQNVPLVIAQAAPPAQQQAPAAEQDKDKKPQPPAKPQSRPQTPAPPQAQPQPPAQPHAQTPPATPQPHAQTPPAAPQPRAAEERRDEQRGPRREDGDRRPPQPSQAQPAQPQQPAAPSTAQQPQRPAAPATVQERRDERRDDRREGQREERRPQTPSTAQPQQAPQPAPSTAQQPQQRTAPSTAQQPAQPSAPSTAQQPQPAPAPSTAQQPQPRTAPSTAQQPAQPTAPSTAQQPQPAPAPSTAQQPQQPGAPATAQQPQTAPAAQTANPTAVAPPTQARNANEFIRRDGSAPTRNITEIRQERQESRDGNRTIFREPDRIIIREGDRTIIRHNEAGRFAIDARNVRTERRGANIETIVERGNGVQIVTVTDPDGRLLRRMRRDQGGREVIIIDNSFAPRTETVFVQLPPPVIRLPRERYILDAGYARPEEIYEVFMEPPVERIAERYTLEQVRYSAPLRDRMPRVDLDVTFETGSWQLSPDQIDRLGAIADGIKRAVQRNPREVFMVEGHTDAVGPDVDNLSLSDRRAEAVAVALTEQFQVPAENLVTQGYGEQQLKVPTDGPEQANRRVAVRRITPLIDQQAASTGAR